MATLISLLPDHPHPLEGQERSCRLRLTKEDDKGWRISANAVPTGRCVGRWMSDCPLSCVWTAKLWLHSYDWLVEQDPLTQRVLDEVPTIIPMPPPQVARHLVDALKKNLPEPVPLESLQGGTPEARQLPARAAQQGAFNESAVPRLGARQTAPAGYLPAPQSPPSAAGGAVPRQAPPAAPPPDGGRSELSEESRAFGRVLRDALVGLRDGYDPQEVHQYLYQALYAADEEEGVDEPDEEGGLRLDLDAIDEEIAAMEAEAVEPGLPRAPAGHQPGPAGLPPLPDGLRPLPPGQPLPGATPEQQALLDAWGEGDEAIREKLARTHARSQRAIARARAGAARAARDSGDSVAAERAKVEQARAEQAVRLKDQGIDPRTLHQRQAPPGARTVQQPHALTPSAESGGNGVGVPLTLTPEQAQQIGLEQAREAQERARKKQEAAAGREVAAQERAAQEGAPLNGGGAPLTPEQVKQIGLEQAREAQERARKKQEAAAAQRTAAQRTAAQERAAREAVPPGAATQEPPPEEATGPEGGSPPGKPA